MIYKHILGEITSFCIGFNAGAAVEEEKELGLAHVVEHMIFKGTKSRTEAEINEGFDELYGFNNAMTNFPYVIYYGTSLSENFHKAFELYSDILVNPAFVKKGFSEEIDVICEELKEWKDDNFQLCEDEMLKNAFDQRRIKNLIIGEEESVRSYTIEDIKKFYNKHYCANNCVITVVTNLELDAVLATIEKYMSSLKSIEVKNKFSNYEKNKQGKFIKIKEGMESAKVQYCFTIDHLTEREVNALKVFNNKFGEGISNILYEEIRTKNGLAYDVFSELKYEEGIKLFTICLGTSKEKIEKAIEIINNIITGFDYLESCFTKGDIEKYTKRVKLRNKLAVEKSIELAKRLTVDDIMFGNSTLYIDENITTEEILNTVKKVLIRPTIQILTC